MLRQRDFLEGKTVAAMLAEALATVPNPTRDPDIDQACPVLEYGRGHALPCALERS